MKKIVLLLTLIIFAGNAFSQHQYHCRIADPTAQERNHSVDITHMKVDVKFDVKAGKVLGKVTHEFLTLQQNIDTIFFNAPGIKINSAQIDGKAAEFNIIPEGVVVKIKDRWSFDEKHTIDFDYVATPKRGLYFIGWNQPVVQEPTVWHTRQQIWTQGQGIDNRHWIPMYDDMGDKFYTETIITFDENYKVLSNGDLISKKNDKKGNTKWHYRLNNPHAGYLLMLAIGKYEVKSTKTKRGTPVNFWYYPEFKERVEYTSMHTEKMIEFLEDETGVAYPWGAYSQVMVQDFLYGAMENTSATIFGDFFFVDERAYLDRNYVGVNCHELTHQWFGDLITARGPGDAWLQESFATYYAKIFDATIIDDNEVKFNFRRETRSALNASKKDLYPIRHTKSGTARIYPKGSAVLQMLRTYVGDQEFKRVIQYYLNKHKFANVNTDDFQQAFKDKLGMNMDWFFEQWVWQGNEPHYKVSFTEYGNKGSFQVDQIHETTQANGYFKMPIDFTIAYKNGTIDRKKVWVQGASTTVSFDTKGKDVSYVLFDENCMVLKKVTFDKPERMLIKQAQNAEHAIDRFDAVAALDKKKDDEKVQWFTAWYDNEKAYQVRREMIRQVGGNQKALALIQKAAKDASPRVREEVAKQAKAAWAKSILEGLLQDKSYKVVEAAFSNLSNADIKFNVDAVAGVDGINNAIAAKYLAYKYSLLGDESYANQLVEMAGPAYEFRTRINAFEALKSINFLNAQAAKNITQATTAYNHRLSSPAKATIAYFKKQQNFRRLFK
jgi:aminopeptidase N